MDLKSLVEGKARAAREAASALALLSTKTKNDALAQMARGLEEKAASILESNRADLERARGRGMPRAFLDRLTLTEPRIEEMARAWEGKGAFVRHPDERAAHLRRFRSFACLCWCFSCAPVESRSPQQMSAERAAYVHRRGCDTGSMDECAALGFMYAKGRGVAKDEVLALWLYQRACDGGSAKGCASLGVMYATGRGVTQDEARAVSLFDKACDGGFADGFSSLGFMYREGRGVAKDAARAASL